MEHFIGTVRQYPCLWNTTAIEYRDQELKDAAWAEVMKETDLSSVKEVKLKWKKLRDSYRDALKRQSEMMAKDPTNTAKKNYPWKYMGLMQFLQPYMSNRKKAAGAAPAAAGNGHSRASSSSSSEDAEPPPARGRLSAIDRKLHYLCKARRAARADRAPHQHPDPLDIFFNGMCQSTKRFPYPTQIKIKRKLFEAVTEAEEALVAEQQSYASLWARAEGSSSSSEHEEEDRKPS